MLVRASTPRTSSRTPSGPRRSSASTSVGVILATRRPRNPIGWILLGNGMALVLAGLAPPMQAIRWPTTLPNRHTARGSFRYPRLAAAVRGPHSSHLRVPPTAGFPRSTPRSRSAAVASFCLTFVTGMLSDETLEAPFEAVRPEYAASPAASGFSCGASALLAWSTVVLGFVAMVRASRRGHHPACPAQVDHLRTGLVPLAILVGTLSSTAQVTSAAWPWSFR